MLNNISNKKTEKIQIHKFNLDFKNKDHEKNTDNLNFYILPYKDSLKKTIFNNDIKKIEKYNEYLDVKKKINKLKEEIDNLKIKNKKNNFFSISILNEKINYFEEEKKWFLNLYQKEMEIEKEIPEFKKIYEYIYTFPIHLREKKEDYINRIKNKVCGYTSKEEQKQNIFSEYCEKIDNLFKKIIINKPIYKKSKIFTAENNPDKNNNLDYLNKKIELNNLEKNILENAKKNILYNFLYKIFKEEIVQEFSINLPKLPKYPTNQDSQRYFVELKEVKKIIFFKIKSNLDKYLDKIKKNIPENLIDLLNKEKTNIASNNLLLSYKWITEKDPKKFKYSTKGNEVTENTKEYKEIKDKLLPILENYTNRFYNFLMFRYRKNQESSSLNNKEIK